MNYTIFSPSEVNCCRRQHLRSFIIDDGSFFNSLILSAVMPGLKRPSSTSGNTADYSTFCLSESLSVSVRTKPRTFSSPPHPSLPVQCHVHTSRLKKRQSWIINSRDKSCCLWRHSVIFGFCYYEFYLQGHRDTESRSQTTAFDWLMLKYQLVLCCEGGI